jgi:ATP-binding cassette subfamily C (CFTR/MRP) protein 10
MGGLRAARYLYQRMNVSVFNAPLSFFEKTSIGRLINRFGKDTNTVDDNLPFMVNIVLAQFFQLLGACFVMAYVNSAVLIVLAVVGILNYKLQIFYRCSSRELRRLESVHKSPVYNLFSECCSNALVIRSLGSRCLLCKVTELHMLLDNSLRVSLSSSVASQWLGARLQLLGGAVSGLLALGVILNSRYLIFDVSPALAGISLIYSFNVVSILNGLVNSCAESEQEMVILCNCADRLLYSTFSNLFYVILSLLTTGEC